MKPSPSFISILSLSLWLSPAAALFAQPQPSPVSPNASTQIEVIVLEATTGDAGIPPALAGLRPLRQPPFNTFGSYRLLSRRSLPLSTSPASTPLPNGSASITLRSQHSGRYAVSVTFDQSGRSSTIDFAARAGEPFFTVRSSHPDRALVIGFIVR